MSAKPDLNAVWQESWGVQPDPQRLRVFQEDTSRAPVIWPDDSNHDGFSLVAVDNGGVWLTLLKIREAGAVSDLQVQALEALGFRKGNEGRLISPAYPSVGMIETVARILRLPIDVLDSKNVATLKAGGYGAIPRIPVEVQAGIRDYWKKQPDILVEEIAATLADQMDDLPDHLRRLMSSEEVNGVPVALSNPTRLQGWVIQALEGEITPVTEPILSLGLFRGTADYGPAPSDWPVDCQTFHEQLAEFRGESVGNLEEAIDPANMPDDRRPPLQARVEWLNDNTRKHGVVVARPDNEDELWVIELADKAGEPSRLPFFFPRRHKIALADVVYPEIARAAPSVVAEAPVKTLFDALPEDSGAVYQKQPDISLADLPNRLITMRQREDILSESLVARVRHQILGGNVIGQHPLLVSQSTNRIDLVYSWRNLEGDFHKYHRFNEAQLDAEVIARDILLESFNKAQPDTIGGARSALAVLPAGYGSFLGENAATDTEMVEALNGLEICRVGFHPLLMPKVLDALTAWQNEQAPILRKSSPGLATELEYFAVTLRSESQTLGPCAFNQGSQNLIQAHLRRVYHDLRDQVRADLPADTIARDIDLATVRAMQGDEGRAMIEALGEGKVFARYQDAANHINGHSDRSSMLADKNQSMLEALADLAQVSVEDVLATKHPLFTLIDVVQDSAGVQMSKAQWLGLMNVDLTERLSWVGQLAAMHGVGIDLAHTKLVREKPTAEDGEKLQQLGMRSDIVSSGLPRLAITSGLLRVGYTRYPFQVGVVAKMHNLLTEKLKDDRIAGFTPFIADSDRILSGDRQANVSLGQLVDLHRLAPIPFGAPLQEQGQVIRVEALDELKVQLYGIDHLSRLATKAVGAQSGIGALDEAEAMPELLDTAYSSAADLQGEIRSAKEILLSGTPVWRDQPGARKDLEDAVRLFIQDFKPLSTLSNPDRMVERLITELASNADSEILVLAAKGSRSKVRWQAHVVTKDDLIKRADNDRDLAVEYGVLDLKRNSMAARKGHQFGAFDIAKTLRPEAIRYLNELKQKSRLEHEKDLNSDEPKRRGARQDKGRVAGLAIKDLRGSMLTVLATLSTATESDQKKFITKTKLWETPDWSYLRAPSDEDRNLGAKPMEPLVAAFFDELRKRILPAPPANIPHINQMFARFVLGVRDQFDVIRTKEDLETALSEGGALHKLMEKLRTDTKEIDLSPGMVVGDDAVSGSMGYMGKAYAFSTCHYRATSRSNNNSKWDIKEVEAGSGRRPVPRALTDDPDIDAGDSEKKLTGAMPMLSQLTRKGGEDYRGGLDVNEDAVINTFGFSGVEYGKSMSQADRTRYLNEAYDGFMDLSKLLDIPPRALSLGGSLGLAFGSRGRGGRRAALAHFEPANNAINLTRMKGAGSMAHEYGHAFANYLFRVSRGLEGSRAPGDITAVMDRQLQSKSEILAGNLREPVANAVAEVLKNIRYTPTEQNNTRASLFVTGAMNADEQDRRGADNRYWSTIEELFARAFETYVSVGLKERFPGFQNDFLVRDDKLKVWGFTPYETRTAAEKARAALNDPGHKEREVGEKPSAIDEREYNRQTFLKDRELRRITEQAQLYPGGQEMDRIKAAFDHLFQTLETKEKKVHHDHMGDIMMPVLYSAGSGLNERITQRDHGVIAECVMSEIARMCGKDVWVRFQDWVKDPLGNKMAGQYTHKRNAAGQVQAVIDIAFGAGIHTAHHEAFHYAQDYLIKPAEQTMLNRFFNVDSPLYQRLIDALRDNGRDDALEVIAADPREAQAYAYELWVKGDLDLRIEEAPIGVFGRVQGFFNKVVGLVQDAGFKNPEQLFQAFYQGHLRERAEKEMRDRAGLEAAATQKEQTLVIGGASTGYAPSKKNNGHDGVNTNSMANMNSSDQSLDTELDESDYLSARM